MRRSPLVGRSLKASILATALLISLVGCVASEEPEPVATGTFDGHYQLLTLDSANDTLCLEGNQVADDAMLGGAAFMDACQFVTGQLWTIEAAEEVGYYTLQTARSAESGECFEGNLPDDENALLLGAAHMAVCDNGPGQNWLISDAGDGAYRLHTQESGNDFCLEGNRIAEYAIADGGSFLDSCDEVTGQYWLLTPVGAESTANTAASAPTDLRTAVGAQIDTSVTYRLHTAAASNEFCLEGNSPGEDSVLFGASFLDTCQDVSGQVWSITETSDPEYYTLQSLQHAETFRCFDANSSGPDATALGAAFMNDCGPEQTQLWRFVEQEGGYVLQPQAQASQNLCLQGATLSDESILGGAAHLQACRLAAEQIWILEAMT